MRIYGIFLILTYLFLAGCGGGGDSSSANGTASTQVPTTAPSLPQPHYTGSLYAAYIEESIATDIVNQFNWASSLSRDLPSASSSLVSQYTDAITNITETGPSGGSATIIGRYKSIYSAWYEITYTKYAFTDSSTGKIVTANGKVIVIFGQQQTGNAQPTYTVGFDSYEVLEGKEDAVLQGNVVMVGNSQPDDVKANLVVTDLQSQQSVYLSNFEESLGTDGVSYVYSGRIYNSGLGYLEVGSMNSSTASSCSNLGSVCAPLPQGASDITFTGASSEILHIRSLDNDYEFMGIDLDGNGTVDEGTRLIKTVSAAGDSFQDAIDDGTHDGVSDIRPVAQILQSTYAEVGTPVYLDGGYSYEPQGWVTYNWSLVQAPPGSKMNFQSDETPGLQFVPDVSGKYLFQLSVQASTGTSTSLWLVDVGDAGSVDTSLLYGQLGNPSAQSTVAGQPVWLDRSAAIPSSSSTEFSWNTFAPLGSGATLENVQSVFPILTPDLPGFYQLAPYEYPSYESIAANWTMVSVGANTYLGESVPFGGYGNFVVGLSCGIFDKSGLPSVAMIGSDSSFRTDISLWLRTEKSSYLFDGVMHLNNSQESNTSSGDGLLKMDFNGDEQEDIVAEDFTGATVYLSQLDGTYLPETLSLPTGQTDLGIATSVLDVSNSANTRAVTISDSTGTTPALYTYLWNGTGFNSAIIDSSAIPASSSRPLFTEADVTGDGYADAIFCVNYVTGNAKLAIEPGDGTGHFGTATYYDLSATSCQNIKTADLNGDGRQDVIVADGTNLDVFIQSSSGVLVHQSPLSLTSEVSDMLVTDLSEDKYPDVIVLHGGSQQIGIFWGTNAAPIGPEYTEGIIYYGDNEYAFTDTGAQLTSCDFNDDGIPDVAFESNGNMYVMYGERIN